MIISVEEIKQLIDFKDWSDAKIERKLNSIEQTIRAYTNNNFQKRTHRKTADIVGGLLAIDQNDFFRIDDTVQISESMYNNGLYTVIEVSDESIRIDKDILDETGVLVTKVEYPADVIDCCINLMEWEINNRSKVGIQSETLSRHSVTYFNQDAGNEVMGYPASLLGCLKAYRKLRC